MILIISCLIVIIVILIIKRRNDHLENMTNKSNSTGNNLSSGIDKFKYILKSSHAIIIKESQELRNCLYNNCSIVYNETHNEVSKTLETLLESYYPRIRFLVSMLIHSKDINSHNISNLSNVGINHDTIQKVIEAVNNNMDITPFIFNLLYIFDLELKGFIIEFKQKFNELEKTNLVKNYLTCLCNHCENINVNIENILNKISEAVERYRKELKEFMIYNAVHHQYNDIVDNLFSDWIDIFEYIRTSIKKHTSNCLQTQLTRTPSYCGGSLFPPSNVTTIDNRNIYNPGNFIFSNVKDNEKENNNNLVMLGNIHGNIQAQF
jgi:hypothetical protein